MRGSSLFLGACLAAISLPACDRVDQKTDAAADQPLASETGTNAPADAAPGDADAGGMRYRCEGDYGVVIHGDTARVSTPDGSRLDLQRVADRSPPLFAGEAFEFSVQGDGAVLGQDEGGGFPCEEAE